LNRCVYDLHMHVTRIDSAKPYTALKHSGVTALRLQGKEASESVLWVGMSTYQANGNAELASSPSEKIYVVLEGEITVITDQGATTLGPLDSCLIGANEARSVENRSGRIAKMLVISPA
jgi:quercetin dioxygenase-like cupin family protein